MGAVSSRDAYRLPQVRVVSLSARAVGDVTEQAQEDADVVAREPAARDRRRRVIVVSGAKGGVGKTMFCANLGLYLATIGRRVVVVDADPDGANVHSVLGVDRPLPGATTDLAAGDRVPSSPADLLETSTAGLRVLHGGMDEPVVGQSRRRTHRQLQRRLKEIDAEYVVIDAGAGTDTSLLDLWLGSHLSLFLTVPEPTAIENTHRFLRHAFARHVRAAVDDREASERLEERLRAMGTPGPLDLERRLEAVGDPLADLVRNQRRTFRFRFAINMARARSDLELADAMRTAVRRRMGISIEPLGTIETDDMVQTSLKVQRPLLVESPGCKASKAIERIARRLLAFDAPTTTNAPVREVPWDSHHDLLEVERGATDEEIRRAVKRMKEIFSRDALVCYGLFGREAFDPLEARLEEAHDVLLDPARRKAYDLSVFPPETDMRTRARSDVDADAVLPPAPEIAPDAEFTGALLKAVRQARGVDLAAISVQTRISPQTLQAIEEDDFGALPAAVYVHGFVTEMAKCLRLDASQASRSYVRRYRRFLEQRAR